jgi:hypothetical protein
MTPRRTVSVGLMLAAAIAGGAARADEWDDGGGGDNFFASTRNVLLHGSEQTHDMAERAGLQDEDWYRIATRPFSSYQVLVDGQSGGLQLRSNDIERYNRISTIVIYQGHSTEVDSNPNFTLDWVEQLIPSATLIRVSGAGCGSGCGAQARYRLSFYDTTYTIPRFNNTGTQTTVLLIQNASNQACSVNLIFFDAAGVLLDILTPGTFNPNSLIVLPTASSFPNLSGSVRIAHTCGYGGLSGKAVSVEPATGFAFDTPLVPRPH